MPSSRYDVDLRTIKASENEILMRKWCSYFIMLIFNALPDVRSSELSLSLERIFFFATWKIYRVHSRNLHHVENLLGQLYDCMRFFSLNYGISYWMMLEIIKLFFQRNHSVIKKFICTLKMLNLHSNHWNFFKICKIRVF